MAMPLTTGALQADGSVKPEASFEVQHVADAIVHVASLPNDVTVLVMNIMYVFALYDCFISSALLVAVPLLC